MSAGRVYENVLTFLAGIIAVILLIRVPFPYLLFSNCTSTDESMKRNNSILEANSSGLRESCLQTKEVWVDPALLSFSFIVGGILRALEANSHGRAFVRVSILAVSMVDVALSVYFTHKSNLRIFIASSVLCITSAIRGICTVSQLEKLMSNTSAWKTVKSKLEKISSNHGRSWMVLQARPIQTILLAAVYDLVNTITLPRKKLCVVDYFTTALSTST